MWKTIYRTEIKDGWGVVTLDLMWEYGMIDGEEVRGKQSNLVIIDEKAVSDSVEWLLEHGGRDKRWDILSDACAMLEKSFMASPSKLS